MTRRLAMLQPFLGILLVAGGWALSHQIGSDSVFDGCTSRGGGFVVLVSFVGLVISTSGGLISFAVWRVPERTGRSFLGLVGGLLALLAGFAIVLQIAAGLILPACAS
jgi:hypothetical protein